MTPETKTEEKETPIKKKDPIVTDKEVNDKPKPQSVVEKPECSIREKVFLSLVEGAARSDALVTRSLKKEELDALATHLVNFSAVLAKKYQES